MEEREGEKEKEAGIKNDNTKRVQGEKKNGRGRGGGLK